MSDFVFDYLLYLSESIPRLLNLRILVPDRHTLLLSAVPGPTTPSPSLSKAGNFSSLPSHRYSIVATTQTTGRYSKANLHCNYGAKGGAKCTFRHSTVRAVSEFGGS